jgi:hypothetical protein
MPLQKLQFRPGVNREGTTLSNEGGWFDCDKIRFRSGYPEKIGGWQRDGGSAATTDPVTTLVSTSGLTTAATVTSGTGSYWGIAKAMWNWINLTGYNLLSVGTNLKYYIQNSSGGAYNDVTPIRLTNAGVANAFTTTNTSTTVTVNDPGHGAQVGDFVNITSVSGAVNGIPAADLTGEFQVQSVVSNNKYTVIAKSAATSTSTSAVTATFNYQLTTGNTTFTYGVGWGVGGWGGSSGPAAASTINGGTAVTASSTTPITLLSVTGYNNGAASMTTSTISATGVLTVGTLASGTIYVGMVVTGTGVDPGTYIISNVSGTGTGSIWNTNTTTAVASTTITGGGGVVFIGIETITYTAIAGSTLAGTITRGVGSTPTSAHADGEVVSQFASTATGWGISAPLGLGVPVQLRLWSQSNYGEDLVFNPRGSAMYYWANNSNPNIYDRGQIIKANALPTTTYGVTTKNGTFYPDATCPSVANFVLVSDASRFTFAFGCNDPTGVYATTAQDPMQVRWSDQNTLVTWTPSIANQAGGIRLSHGSAIVTAIQTRQEILVITDAAIYSFQYLGAPYVWGSQILADNISIVSPNAVQVVNNVTYWMGTDKFYMYSGRVETLPCALRQYIYGNINLNESFQIHCGTNEGYNEIWWFYPSITGTTSAGENSTGTSDNPNVLIDRYVIYNHLERTWYYGTMDGTNVRPRTAWLDSPLRAEPMAAIGYTANNSSGVPATYTNGAVVYHETTVDNNETSTPVAITAYVQSSDFDIGDGHNFGFIWRLIPDITFDGSTSAAPSTNFTVRPRQNPGANYGSSDNPFVNSAQSYAGTTTYNVQQFTQQVFVRIRGRQMAFRISSTDANGLGVQWQLGVPRIDVRPDGRR